MARRRRRILAALAATPLVLAAAKGLRYTASAARARRQGDSLAPGVPVPPPSPGLAAAVALDSLIIMPMTLLSSTGSPATYRRASAELDDAVAFYGEAGWLDDPAGRHPGPATVPDGDVTVERGVEVLRFDSGWQPDPDEPGADRWRSFTDNATVPVRLLRHPGGPRPWLVAVHGQGMGRPGDARMLRVRRLHERLGVNVALPVLPLHGSRAAGFAPDQQFVSNLFLVNNVLGLTQSIWDVRRLLLWLREAQGAPAVGAFGLSLGSYVCSVLSTVEGSLASVVAVVPTSDLAGSLRAATPVVPKLRALHADLHDERSTAVHHVVSPLARPCLVPHDRRFIIAGQADGIAAPAGAAELWRHWGEPSMLWRPRGHVTTGRSAEYDNHLEAILRSSGLVGGPQEAGWTCAS